MKIITGVVIMLLVIFMLAYYSQQYLRQKTTEIRGELLALKTGINNRNWDEVEEQYKIIRKNWEQVLAVITFLKDQGELHDLEITLARISPLIENRDTNELLTEISIARKLLTNIYEQERLSLKNIF